MLWKDCGGNAPSPAPSPDPRVTGETDDDRLITAILPDGALAPIDKMEAHRIGAQHLAISIFVFAPDAAGKDALLIQRRADSKYHCGGMWANTCCTHPDWGEEISAAADRRLEEELGLRAPLTPTTVIDYRADVGAGLIENERVQVFVGRLDSQDVAVAPNPAEVSEVRWGSVDALLQEAQTTPERLTPWFRIYLSRWAELGLD